MRLIDADEVVRLIQARYECPEICKREIDAIKTVDPVKHGHWIEDNGPQYYGYTGQKCSICGGESDERGNYCPSCGARMDGEV